MNIGVAYDNGQIAQNLGGCRTFLVVTTEGQNPTGKHLAQAGTITRPRCSSWRARKSWM